MKPNHLIDPDLIVAGSIRAEQILPGSVPASKLWLAGFDIGEAIALLRDGRRVRRAGWNGKGMYLELQVPDAHSKMSLPYVFMFTACKNRVPWLCSQTDLLAKDWEIALDDALPVEPAPVPLSPVDAAEREWELAK